MPGTPSVRQDVATTDIDASRQTHTTCPPEEVRDESWGQTEMDVDVDVTPNDDAQRVATGNQQLTTPLLDISRQNNQALSFDNQQVKKMDIDEESPAVERLSPDSMEEKQEVKSGTQQSLGISNYMGSSLSMDYEFSNVRLRPSSPSSYLRSGSKFHGTQQSERQVYEVQVEIKHVDMRESFLCGYLRIQGLTEDHPTLTTYFEGEIIGSKYSFLTKHEDWGSTDKVDLEHWAKFQAFRPFQRQARKGNLYIPNVAQRENIFMRWKEHFLLPDHRVRTISGASFEGFYYICFNQCQGTVSGIYFHAKSEKFQQLELKHVEDRGTFGAMEFR